ncbi:cadherin-12-like isoform X3 [Phyllopteryx taeniolatus]|uniref:cadherin-12-like isoform X3 n=1 Tax=Phyllopteryx taeniolatus TaxID=161469 RepID=UPI002AD1E160|nr:cadherin-12-like isoform X3 [Phyllopteryx taeniolatus]
MITWKHATVFLVCCSFLLDYSSPNPRCPQLQLQVGRKGGVKPAMTFVEGRPKARPKHGRSRVQRIKRGWVWNQFFVLEEYMGSAPQYVGKIHTDMDQGDNAVKYSLSGEGAASMFTIDQITGDIHVLMKLDREEKSYYILQAQATDVRTGLPLEPETEFIIKVLDINDNEPRFPDGPYIAIVPEMSPTGTFVTQVTATDADDPTYGNSAQIVYSILHSQPYFTVDPKSGVIRTAFANMDREVKDVYQVIIQAQDMGGQLGGLASTTTINITLGDVNDNPPRFARSIFHLRVAETALLGSVVGRILATDLDTDINAKVDYSIVPGVEGIMFDIISVGQSQEGVLVLKKALDYETKKSYIFNVEASNVLLDPRFLHLGPFRDSATVKVNVLDMDERPVFTKPYYSMDTYEDTPPGAIIGSVTAHDLDASSSAVRYSLEWQKEYDSYFDIHTIDGTVTMNENLDREETFQHNITVVATKVLNPLLSTKVLVIVNVLDVNEFPPELIFPPSTFVCETSKAGQIIQTVSAVDFDLPPISQRFFFNTPKDRHNRRFTVRDYGIISALFISRRRHKDNEAVMTSKEDIRDNVIHYDDEGGGEEDTHAFDIETLCNTHSEHVFTKSIYSKKDKNNYGHGVLLHLRTHNDEIKSPDIHQQSASIISLVNTQLLVPCCRVTQGKAEIIEFNDEQVSAYDSLASEDHRSVTASHSSIAESWVIDDLGDFSSLGDWGQSFKSLAGIFGRHAPTVSEES